MRKMLLFLILAALSSTVFVAAQKVWDDDYRTGPYGSYAYAYVEAWYVYTPPPHDCYFNFIHNCYGGASTGWWYLYPEYWPGQGQSSRTGGYTYIAVFGTITGISYRIWVSACAKVGYVSCPAY
ncbi:MAG: hypothetical protein ACUVQY_04495 [Thermoproteota archaeon]